MTSIAPFRVSVRDAAGRLHTVEAPSVLEAVAALTRRCRLPGAPRWTLMAKRKA